MAQGPTNAANSLPFGPSGASHSQGLVPDPGASAGTAKFLREDATWQAPVGVVTSVAGRIGNVVLGESDISGLVTDLAAKAGLGANTFTGWQTISPASGASYQIINAVAGQQAMTVYEDATANKWFAGKLGDLTYVIFDAVNSRNHFQLTAGASNSAANATLFSNLALAAGAKYSGDGSALSSLGRFRVYDVSDYGATGGGGDYGTSINNAIQAAKTAGSSYSGAIVFFPAGFYGTSVPLVLPRTGNPPSTVVHLLGETSRTSVIFGTGGFPTGRALVEWEATTSTIYQQRIAHLMLSCPAVNGTKAIWHKANHALNTLADVMAEWLQLDLEDVLIEGDNAYQDVLIDLEVGVRMSTWRNVFGDPSRAGAVNYNTLLLRTPTVYGARTVTDAVTTAGSTAVSSATATFTSADNGKMFIAPGVPNGTTMTFATSTTATLSNNARISATGVTATIAQGPGFGEDSIGVEFCTFVNLQSMIRRGGWARLIQARAYQSKFIGCFDNGGRSGDGATGYWFSNSNSLSLDSCGHEGSGGTALFRFTHCQSVEVVNANLPIGYPTEPIWTATTAYALGQRVVSPSLTNVGGIKATSKKVFTVTTAGTSGGGEPAWPASGTIADGTVTWTVMANDAVGTPLLLEACDEFRGRTRWFQSQSPAASDRLGYAVVADGDCRQCYLENWTVRARMTGGAGAVAEFSIDPAATFGATGSAVQDTGNYRAFYEFGLRPYPERTSFFVGDYGAKIDGRFAYDATATNGSATLTSPTAGFLAGRDEGKAFHVSVGANVLNTTIKTVNSATSVVLNANWTFATATGTANISWGTIDNPAIASAAAAASLAGGGTVMLGMGTSLIDPASFLPVYSNVSYAGCGPASVLKVKAGVGDYIGLFRAFGGDGTLVQHVEFRDFTIDQNPVGNSNANVTSGVTARAATCIYLLNFRDVAVRRVHFDRACGTGAVFLPGSSGNASAQAVVENCYVKFQKGASAQSPFYDNTAIYIEAMDARITMNTLVVDETSGTYQSQRARQAIELHSPGGIISGNMIDGYMAGCYFITVFDDALNTRNTYSSALTGNTITRATIGIMLAASPTSGAANPTLKGIVVSGNMIDLYQTDHDYDQAYGIGLAGTLDVSDVTLIGNTITFQADTRSTSTFLGHALTAVFAGIYLNATANVSDVTIIGNTITGAPLHGVLIGAINAGKVAQRIQVARNNLVDCGINASHPNASLRAYVGLGVGGNGNLADVVVADNTLYDTGNPNINGKYGVYADNGTGTVARVKIGPNLGGDGSLLTNLPDNIATNKGWYQVYDPVGAINTKPFMNQTFAPNTFTQIAGMPYIVPSGIAVTVMAGAVLRVAA